ncbi:MAG: hypothetical protein AB1Z98_08560 [Nannocystaceae bacterium]
MRWSEWKTSFEGRRDRPLPPIGDVTEIPPDWREPLAASLARFQLGETGEGRVVADLRRRAASWGIHPDYLESLRLFIAEEGRHAAILGVAVQALGGQTLRRTWSATAFGRVRRVAGPGLELLVLLAAEVAALTFYGTLVDRLPRGPLRAALQQIASDESMHVRFHVAFLGSALPSPLVRRAVATAWSGLGLLAGTVIAIDHGRTLRELGVTQRAVLKRARGLVVDIDDAIATAVPSSLEATGAAAAWGLVDRHSASAVASGSPAAGRPS